MKKIVLASLLILTLNMGTVRLVVAQETNSQDTATSEGTIAPSETQTTQKLKERIEKIVEEKKEQISETLNQLSKTKRGFVGQVQRVSEETITIVNQNGSQIISVENGAKFIKNDKEIDANQLAVDNWVSVIGMVEEDTFVPKQVTIFATSLRPKEHVVMLGSISSLEKNSLEFLSRNDSTTHKLTLGSKTNYFDFEGKKAKMSDFEEKLQVLVVGYKNESDIQITTLKALAAF